MLGGVDHSTEELDNSWLKTNRSHENNQKDKALNPLSSNDSEIELKFLWNNERFLLVEKNNARAILNGEIIETGKYSICLSTETLSDEIDIIQTERSARFFSTQDNAALGFMGLSAIEERDIISEKKAEVLEDPLLFLEKGQPIKDTWYENTIHASYYRHEIKREILNESSEHKYYEPYEFNDS